MSIEALPCLVCGKRLVNVWEDAENQPDSGVACITHGNYGSTVWDPVMTGEFLEFNICDECLVKAGEQDRVYTARDKRPVHMGEHGIVGWHKAPYAPVLWKQGMPGYEDDLYVEDAEEFQALGDKATMFPDLKPIFLGEDNA